MNGGGLSRSAVVFDEAAHTYTLGGRTLRGVTGIVHWVYPETYAEIPQHVLERAAERGVRVHKGCEAWDSVRLMTDIPEVAWYAELERQYGLVPVANEYLVSDDADIASSIDVVFGGVGGTDFRLADIKCTSRVIEENVTLQLSIYAWLFELCNPGMTVSELAVVWLPKPQYGRPEYKRLRRITAGLCEAIVRSYLDGGDGSLWAGRIDGELNPAGMEPDAPALPLATAEGTLPAELEALEEAVVGVETELRCLKARQEELRDALLAEMRRRGARKWSSGRLSITRVPPCMSVSVDGTKLKREFPDVWERCRKTVERKEGVTIKIHEHFKP